MLQVEMGRYIEIIAICRRYRHWRRQLWGTGARVPIDFQLFTF